MDCFHVKHSIYIVESVAKVGNRIKPTILCIGTIGEVRKEDEVKLSLTLIKAPRPAVFGVGRGGSILKYTQPIFTR
jgi:hypothetical protein